MKNPKRRELKGNDTVSGKDVKPRNMANPQAMSPPDGRGVPCAGPESVEQARNFVDGNPK